MDQSPEWYKNMSAKQQFFRDDTQDMKYLHSLMNNARDYAAHAKPLRPQIFDKTAAEIPNCEKKALEKRFLSQCYILLLAARTPYIGQLYIYI